MGSDSAFGELFYGIPKCPVCGNETLSMNRGEQQLQYCPKCLVECSGEFDLDGNYIWLDMKDGRRVEGGAEQKA